MSDNNEIYQKLAAPFDETFKDNRGGVDLEYVTGEQVTSRLNEDLGVMGWSFRVIEHGVHAEADECWALGELTATHDGVTVTRQQFGSQKIKRSRASGTPMDIGFDLKGATTDCLKKCASLIGIGLYLSKKEQPQGGGYQGGGYSNNSGGSGYSQPASQDGGGFTQGQGQQGTFEADALYCEECNEPLTETRFKDGTNWAPAQLAVFGRRKHGKVLCMREYREHNQRKRQAEEALQQVPF